MASNADFKELFDMEVGFIHGYHGKWYFDIISLVIKSIYIVLA